MTSRRAARWLIVAALGCPLFSQPAAKRPPEVESVVSLALSLPPEYASDIVLGLISNGAIVDPKWRKELLETVFVRAFSAKNAYARQDTGKLNDTASGRLSAANRLQLDALSIRCRAIGLMLGVSTQRAREMFAAIPALQLPKVKCRDPLVYDVAIYYQTLGEVYRRAFTPADRKKGTDWRFLRDHFRPLNSIDEIVPAETALRGLELPADERSELLKTLTGSFGLLAGGDRQFTFAERNRGLSKEIQLLVPAAASEALLPEYRKFLLSHLSAPRCADSVAPTNPGGVIGAPALDSIRFFNRSLAPLGDRPSLEISEEQRYADPLDERAAFEPLKFPAFNGLLHRLIVRKNGEPASPGEQPLEPEIFQLLKKMEEPDPDFTDCKACRFHEKSSVYNVLIDLLDGKAHETAVESYVSFLSRASMQIAVAKAVEPMNPLFMEDALNPPYSEAWMSLRRSVRIPLLTGEKLELVRGFKPFLDNQAVDIIHPDLAFAGGFTGVKKIADYAAITRTPVALHNVGSLVLTYANAHFGSSIQNFYRSESQLGRPDHYIEAMAAGGAPEVRRGHLTVPVKPGLGLDINPDFLRANLVEGEEYWG